LDEKSDSTDRAISKHVLRMHRYINTGAEGIAPIRQPNLQWSTILITLGNADSSSGGGEETGTSQVLSQYNALLHGGSSNRTPYTLAFLKKYISYAKAQFKPVLTEEAAEMLVGAYRDLRGKNNTQV
jgi:DNA replication licensing factor MCM3